MKISFCIEITQSRFIRKAKRLIMRNDFYVSKIVAASLMGDGSILKDDSGGRNRNGQFRIKQIEQHRDHLDYIANVISSVTTVKFDYIPPQENIVIMGKNTRASGVYLLRTQNHPMYTDLRRRWYLDGIKRIDPHALTLIDAEFLAIWYQQDGYIATNHGEYHGTYICTDCFSYGDLTMLRRAIIEKTGFVFNIIKKGTNKLGEQTYRLSLYKKQLDSFRSAVYPYMQKSFLYKITGNNLIV